MTVKERLHQMVDEMTVSAEEEAAIADVDADRARGLRSAHDCAQASNRTKAILERLAG